MIGLFHSRVYVIGLKKGYPWGVPGDRFSMATNQLGIKEHNVFSRWIQAEY